LLGGLDVEGTPTAQLGSRKARTLVKVLALGRSAAVPTGAVCEALWPDEGAPARPVDQVGVLVSRLRKVLGPDRLVRTEAGWWLAVDWLDVAELEARATEALERLDAGQHASARTAARAALDLARGPLLPDDEGPWVEGERARCERLVGRVRLAAAEAALQAGDTSTAAAEAERALDVDPFDEAALRTAMRAHVSGGRPASALALYARVRRDLADGLGVSPTAETEALHRSVLLTDAARAPVTVRSQPALAGRTAELEQLRVAAERVGSGGGSWSVEPGWRRHR
jgi:DNA-binding SARP family transcriptional activator